MDNAKVEELYSLLHGIRARVLPHSREILEGHRGEVFHAIKSNLEISSVAIYGGLAPLEKEADKLAGSSIQYDRMLAYGVRSMVDDYRPESVLGKMLEQFPVREGDNYAEFMRYLCVRYAMMMLVGLPEYMIKKACLSMIPKDE